MRACKRQRRVTYARRSLISAAAILHCLLIVWLNRRLFCLPSRASQQLVRCHVSLPPREEKRESVSAAALPPRFFSILSAAALCSTGGRRVASSPNPFLTVCQFRTCRIKKGCFSTGSICDCSGLCNAFIQLAKVRGLRINVLISRGHYLTPLSSTSPLVVASRPPVTVCLNKSDLR